MTPSRNLMLRVVSAAVLIPVVVGIVWYDGLGHWPFAILVMAAAVLMQIEWLRISETSSVRVLEWVRIVVLVAALALGATGAWAMALLLLAILAVVSGVTGHPRDGIRLWPVLGVFYIGIPCLAILWLHVRPDVGRELVLALMAVVWATDIGAYFAGRLIGGAKLAPRLSPNKTWAGAIGGAVAALAVCLAAALALGYPAWVAALALGLCVTIAAQIGDLAESFLKRRFSVKDSGSVIPGHGGLLDRLDSMLLAAPVLAFVFLLFLQP